MDKSLREFLQMAKRIGWEFVCMTQGKHRKIKFRAKDGRERLYTMPVTCSDRRGLLNAKKDLERMYRNEM